MSASYSRQQAQGGVGIPQVRYSIQIDAATVHMMHSNAGITANRFCYLYAVQNIAVFLSYHGDTVSTNSPLKKSHIEPRRSSRRLQMDESLICLPWACKR